MTTRLLALTILLLALFLSSCSLDDLDTSDNVTAQSAPTPTALAKATSTFSVEGKILFSKNAAIWLWENGNVKQLTSGDAYDNPAWSPDGKRIAAIKRANNYSDLVTLSDAGKPDKQLTRFGPAARPRDSSWARMPAWTSSGTRIVFAADVGSYRIGIWTIDPNGSGLARANYRALGDGDTDSPSWSPDGKNLAFAAFWEPVSQIYVANQSTGTIKKLTNHQQGAYDPMWSPDGSRIAYVARTDGKNNVWVMSEDGTNASSVTTIGTARTPRWSSDGQSIAFVASQSQSFDLFALKLSINAGVVSVSGDPRQLTRGQAIDATGSISWKK